MRKHNFIHKCTIKVYKVHNLLETAKKESYFYLNFCFIRKPDLPGHTVVAAQMEQGKQMINPS